MEYKSGDGIKATCEVCGEEMMEALEGRVTEAKTKAAVDAVATDLTSHFEQKHPELVNA